MIFAIKIFISFVLWCAWAFFCVLTGALLGGGPNADVVAVRHNMILMSFIPLVIFILYKLIRVYGFHSGQLLSTENIILFIIPAILCSIFVYTSSF